MYLIQMLLPTQGRESDVARTREELVDAFGGVTAYTRSPAQGVWLAPDGDRERDSVVMVEVLTRQFDREWWRAYGLTLAARFGQEEIHIRALAVEIP
jgi:hypothetical protein